METLDEVTRQRDNARSVIAEIRDALSLAIDSTDEQIVSGARSRFENLYMLGDAAGTQPGETWSEVADRIRAGLGDRVHA